MMAIQNILKNITITDFDDAEMLISAMGKAMKTADVNSVLMGYCYCIDYDTN